jgi:hypothetical protein
MRPQQLILAIGLILSSLTGCGGRQDFETLKKKDISKLTCAQLKFLGDKYSSIGDSAAKLAGSGTSPAATASSVTAMQAYNQASRYYSEMARRRC